MFRGALTLPPHIPNDGLATSVFTGLKPGLRAYSGVADFLARAPVGRGTRYVRIDVTDTDVRPVAR